MEEAEVVSDLHFVTDEDTITILAANLNYKLPFEFTSDYGYSELVCSAKAENEEVVVASMDSDQSVSLYARGKGETTVHLKVQNAETQINVVVGSDGVTRVNWSWNSYYYYIGEEITPNVTILPETAPQGYHFESSNPNVIAVRGNKLAMVGKGSSTIKVVTDFEAAGGYISTSYKPEPVSITVYDGIKTSTFAQLFDMVGERLLVNFKAEVYEEEGKIRLYEPDGDRYFTLSEDIEKKQNGNLMGVTTYDALEDKIIWSNNLADAVMSNYFNKAGYIVAFMNNDGENITFESVLFSQYSFSSIQKTITIKNNLNELGLPAQDAHVKQDSVYVGFAANLEINTIEAGVEKVEVDFGDDNPLDITSSLEFIVHRKNVVTITYFDRHLEKANKEYNSGSGFKSRSGAIAKDTINYTLNDGNRVYSKGVYQKNGLIQFESSKNDFNSGYGYSPFLKIVFPTNYRLIGFDIGFSSDSDKYYWIFGSGTGTSEYDYSGIGVRFDNDPHLKYPKDGYCMFKEDGSATSGYVFSLTRSAYNNAPNGGSVSYIKVLYYVLPE